MSTHTEVRYERGCTLPWKVVDRTSGQVLGATDGCEADAHDLWRRIERTAEQRHAAAELADALDAYRGIA